MKAIDTPLICPYTGLRSFTEEESIYFKGRDEQIDQISRLLERNKFLMLTGASGEGKSSLIYAGLIPNARAGFFKAKYTNWIVADFRPERSPVKNMATAVAETFGVQPTIVETELHRGFSSLIDLYANSSYYTDENDPSWAVLDEVTRKNRLRGAANLLIIVDQFEEFFTNPENYSNSSPSQESQTVVNLALETARIALQRNLPVYVVCTMRSDYIGQCSAFRGLPEYIGFSQFFVPRLKRKEIKQVIEEPAVLSGNRITRRLVERIVYDLADGIDQLPILQHALRQVWLAANEGREEMDLLHYALVGGMPAEDLPESDQPRFRAWYGQLPENQKKFYSNPGLNKIIEIHATRLYESAWLYYNETHPTQPITQKDAKRIVALTFACLTKIDDSRAVRNRMTLQEITRIINRPELTTDVVGGVLDLFRESNNSFIRPYKTEEPSTQSVAADTVLDITHESLIRNWALLNKWASQEFEFYTTFVDFRKQLTRWKDSDKSTGFLLPLGPLTYFENWYQACKPNVWWIDRYSEEKQNTELSLQSSENLLADTGEFIRRSARKVAITRAFMRYGARRIAFGLAAVILLLISGFYWYDARRKTNARVEKEVMSRAHRLLQSKDLDSFSKSVWLLLEERVNQGSLLPYLDAQPDGKDKVNMTLISYRMLLYFDKHVRTALKTDLINRIVADFKSYPINVPDDAAFVLEQQNQFIFLLSYDSYYNPNPVTDSILSYVSGLDYQTVNYFLGTTMKSAIPNVPTEMNVAIQHWLTAGKPSQKEISLLLSRFSPFGDSNARAVFNRYYAKGTYETNGRIASDHNGGYHTTSSLYAALGDMTHLGQCLDSLPGTYFRSTLFNNYTNLLGYLFQYKHEDRFPAFSRLIQAKEATNDPLTIYRNTILRSGFLTELFGGNLISDFHRSHSGYMSVNLSLSSREQFFALAKQYENLATDIKEPEERHYLLAMHYKRIAVLYSKYLYDRGLPPDRIRLDDLLDKAWAQFNQISETHLAEVVPIIHRYYSDGVRNIEQTRRQVFLYPDYRDGWFANKYHGDLFMNYVVRKKLLSHYNSPETIGLIHEWISSSTELYMHMELGGITGAFQNDKPIPDSLLMGILDHVKQSSTQNNFDTNLVHLLLANRSFERGDTAAGVRHFQLLETGEIVNSGSRYEYLNQTYFINAVIDLATHLAAAGHTEESMALAALYQPHEKQFFFAQAADKLYKTYNPEAFVFLDSAYTTSRKVNPNLLAIANPDGADVRNFLVYLLGKVGGEKSHRLSQAIIKELSEGQRDGATSSLILGTATDGNYFTALRSITPDLTEEQEMFYYATILWAVAQNQNDAADWGGMDKFLSWSYTYFLAAS